MSLATYFTLFIKSTLRSAFFFTFADSTPYDYMKRTLLSLLCLLITFTSIAQITSSSISGKVTDEHHQPLPGATIELTDNPTGTVYHAVTDAKGGYRILNIRPGGPYAIEIRMMGFHPSRFDNVEVPLGRDQVINANLVEDNVKLDEIIISAQPVNIERQATTTAIRGEQIASLPTVSRSMNDVLALTPQATTTSSGLALGGGNIRQSYVTVDGATFHNAYGIGGNLPAGGAPISLDALDALTISIAPYDVRQSGFTGAMVNAVTKSGSNNLHVSVYDYFTNDKLTGTEFGQKDAQGRYPERLKLNRSLDNTIGFSVGGPIKRNKLFYFINFEYQSDIDNGQTRLARPDDNTEWSGNTQYNRPTVTMMDSIHDYLVNKYGYDPGAYQNYNFSTPDFKLLARLDWNVNNNHRFTLRYTNTRHQYFSNPSNSITPLSSSLYNKNSFGRNSDYALYFESSAYYQQRNFQSVAAELNSHLLDGRLHNTLRAVYSLQHEPRKLTREVFPTVDILEPLPDGTKAVYTSFGPDPFTYGTGSYVHSFIATDEIRYTLYNHTITAGLQFEFDKTINGFMQGGAGYYVYNSWDDFVTHAAPAAFTITFGNNEAHQQAFPSFNYFQNSLYAQDEMTLNDRFKLTAGVRLEMPMYPSISEYNTNLEFDSLAAIPSTTIYGLSTADMPKANLNLSPRLGFDWDLMGDQRLVLRGGTGIYTGRLPLVWIVTAVCNSNVAQNQFITYTDNIGFYPTVDEIIEHNTDKLHVGNLPAPQYATLLDKDLKMPQVSKSSLTFDAHLPWDMDVSLEGIVSKDLRSVAVTRLGIVLDDSIQLPGEPMKRAHWISEGLKNSINGSVNPYLITNSERKGYYYSITGQVSKHFGFGLDLTASYTYSEGRNVIDGIGDQIMTAFTSNTYGVHGSNSQEVGYSSYVTPHRVLLNAAWTWMTGERTKETISLYYTGFNHCFVGNDSYTRYSYTMTSNVNGDGGANSLIYIPKENELSQMPFISPDNAEAFNDFIKGDPYLSRHRGKYAQRGGAIAPWRHTFNIRYERSLLLNQGKTLSFGIDVNNVANLLYRGWGNIQRLGSGDILSLTQEGLYQFRKPEWSPYANVVSTWAAALNIRFGF